MSEHERASWVSLVVNVFIGLLYFSRVFPKPGDTALLGPGMAALSLNLIITAIFAGILSEVMLRRIQKRGGGDPSRREQVDERDRLINLRAGRNAYVLLAALTACLIGLIATTQWMPAWSVHPEFAHDTVFARMIAGPLTGPLIVQWLLLALTLAGVCKYLTRIVSYRRGY